MGYTITVKYMENESFVNISFAYPYSTYFAVLKWSRFQRIGYVLRAYEKAEQLAHEIGSFVLGTEEVVKALNRYDTNLSDEQIDNLMGLSLGEQRDYVWDLLSSSEQALEGKADRAMWDNFWSEN